MCAVLIIVGVSRALDRNVIFREVRPQTVEKWWSKPKSFWKEIMLESCGQYAQSPNDSHKTLFTLQLCNILHEFRNHASLNQ